MGLRKISAIALVTLLAAQLGFAAPGLAAPVTVVPGTAILMLSGQPAHEAAGLIHRVSSHHGTVSKSKTTHSHRHRHCYYHSHPHHEHHHVK